MNRAVASILRNNDPGRALRERLLMLVEADEERERDLVECAEQQGLVLEGRRVA